MTVVAGLSGQKGWCARMRLLGWTELESTMTTGWARLEAWSGEKSNQK
jgi:hypothetical protein